MKTKRNKELNPFDYEDRAGIGLYVASFLTIAFMIAIIILFALIVAGGIIYIGASI